MEFNQTLYFTLFNLKIIKFNIVFINLNLILKIIFHVIMNLKYLF